MPVVGFFILVDGRATSSLLLLSVRVLTGQSRVVCRDPTDNFRAPLNVGWQFFVDHPLANLAGTNRKIDVVCPFERVQQVKHLIAFLSAKAVSVFYLFLRIVARYSRPTVIGVVQVTFLDRRHLELLLVVKFFLTWGQIPTLQEW